MKNMKKIVSVLLALVMVLGLLPTAAFARVVGEKPASVVAQRAVAAKDKESMGLKDVLFDTNQTYKDNMLPKADGVKVQSGDVTVTQIDKPEGFDLQKAQEDAVAAAQKANAPADTDLVRVIVVLDGESLADQYTNGQIARAGSAVRWSANRIAQEQAAALSDIRSAAVEYAVANTPADQAALMSVPRVTVRYQYHVTINGMAIEIPYGMLDSVKALDGVQTAFVAPQFDLPEDMTQSGKVMNPQMTTTQKFDGAVQTWNAGYTGQNMKIAIVDTGLDLDHQAFVPGEDSGFEPGDHAMTKADLTADVLTNLVANSGDYKGGKLTADNLYINEKVPYGFNYVDNSLDVTHDNDDQGTHGTHVAGISAANKGPEGKGVDGNGVVGVAPDAQLLVMKVFGQHGGAYMDDIVAAVEDAITLGADVVNLSLGSDNGFTNESEEYSTTFGKVLANDMVAAISAGNSHSAGQGNAMGTEANRTSDPDNGIVGSPSTYPGATSVASVDNMAAVKFCFYLGTDETGEAIAYNDVAELNFVENLGGEVYDYVVIPGVGEETDYAGLDVEGKIALIRRGSIDFTTKHANALAAGAVAAIVYNNADDGLMNMMDEGVIPNIFITKEDGAKMVAASVKKIYVPEDGTILTPNATGGALSDFSSWGVTEDLILKPDVAAFGGEIYSTVDGGKYETMSGTSMAAPHLAGMAALVLQHLKTEYPGKADAWYHTVAESLLMSTATPVVEWSIPLSEDVVYDVYTSPRGQGAGLANVFDAVSSPVYATVNGGTPKVSLGADPNKDGVYTFDFTLNNLTDEAVTYVLDSQVLTDYVNTEYMRYGFILMGEMSMPLDAMAEFTVNDAAPTDDEVTVPANGSVTVTATIELSEDDMDYMDTYYENGIYVDGYIFCYTEDGVDLSVPFMGFYGDWYDARIFDEGWWYQSDEEATWDRYPHVLLTNLNGEDGYAAVGVNLYLDEEYDPANNYLSPNGDGTLDDISEIYISLMRQARKVNFDWTLIKADGTQSAIMETQVADYVPRTTYNSNYGICIPMQYNYEYELQPLTEAIMAKKGVEEGDTIRLTVTGCIDYGTDAETEARSESFHIDMKVDVTAPTLTHEKFSVGNTGSRLMRLHVEDNGGIAAVLSLTMAGDVIETMPVDGRAKGTGQEADVYMDLANYPSTFILVAADYAGNESYYAVSYPGAGADLDLNSFYGYIYSSTLQSMYGDYRATNSYAGWYSFTDPAEPTMQATRGDDRVNAAEYVDGYILGVDTDNLFFAMKAGTWERNYIAVLDDYPSIIDMAYDAESELLFMLTDMVVDSVEDEDGSFTEVVSPAHLLAFDPVLYRLVDLGEVVLDLDVELPAKADWAEDVVDMSASSQLITLACDNDGVLYGAALTVIKTTKVVSGEDILGNPYSYEMDTYAAAESALCTLEVMDYDADGDGDVDMDDVQYVLDGVNGVNALSDGVKATFDHLAGSKEELDTADVQVFYEMVLAADGDDVSTVQAEEVGKTGYTPIVNANSGAGYIQAMTVDHDTNKLYWATYDGVDMYKARPSYVREVNKNTGKITASAPIALDSEITGLFKPSEPTGLFDVYDKYFLEEIYFDQDEVNMIVGDQDVLTVMADPYYGNVDDLTWTSSKPSVVTVDMGVITAVGEGTATVTATTTDYDGATLTASCDVTVVALSAKLAGYDVYGNKWIGFDGDAPSKPTTFVEGAEAPSEYDYFTAATYADGFVYAFDSMGGFWKLDPDTMKGVQLSRNPAINGYTAEVCAMAFDICTGTLYAIYESGGYFGVTFTLMEVNPANGALREICELDPMFTADMTISNLAIDDEGTFMAVIYDGDDFYLVAFDAQLVQASAAGGGIGGGMMPLDAPSLDGPGLDDGFGVGDDDEDEDEDFELWPMLPLDMDAYFMGGLECLTWSYDDNGLYFSDTLGNLYFIDLSVTPDPDVGIVMGANFAIPAIPVGTVRISDTMGFTCLVNIPTVPIPVEYADVEEVAMDQAIMVSVGGTASANLTVEPWNSRLDDVTYTVIDTAIATVDENGVVTGVAEGTTTLTAVVEYGSETKTLTATIKVVDARVRLGGYLLTDFDAASGYWLTFLSNDPGNLVEDPVDTMLPEDDEPGWQLLAGAYYDGEIYAYAHDMTGDYNYKFYLVSMTPDEDEDSLEVIAQANYDVRDMTFDYTTGVLWAAVCEGGASALYQVNLETGAFTKACDVDHDAVIWGLAADTTGTLWAVDGDGILVKINGLTGTTTVVGDTGVGEVDMYQSLLFDYKTDNLFWAQATQDGGNGLYLVDTTTGKAVSQGIVVTGVAVSCLYVADEMAEEPEVPASVAATGVSVPAKSVVLVGETVTLTATVLPVSVAPVTGAVVAWGSNAPSVATVDTATGVVTGVSAGTAKITAAISGTLLAQCTVTVLDEARRFYAYDETQMQWISFPMDDPTNVKVEKSEADADVAPITAAAYIDGELYAYDTELNFYNVDMDGFVRGTALGAIDENMTYEAEDRWGDTYTFAPDQVLDLSYDAANDKLYALLRMSCKVVYGDEPEDYYIDYGTAICEVNHANGGMEVVWFTKNQAPCDLLVKNGQAWFVDTYDTGILFFLPQLVENARAQGTNLIQGYAGEQTAGRSLIVDELTDTVYLLLDRFDDWIQPVYLPELFVLTLADANTVEVGDNHVIYGEIQNADADPDDEENPMYPGAVISSLFIA